MHLTSRYFALCLFNIFLGVGFSVNAVDLVKEKALLAVVDQYYAALEAKNLVQLGQTVDADLIVLEGTHKNIGWADYRDHHIGPEMKEWRSFSARDRKILHVEEVGNAGYVIEELSYQITTPKETVNLSAVETFILMKSKSGWKIKHVHSSAKVIKP